ncbi:MAG: ABC transporter ATP-binding protein [Methanomassiliicoccus sp.]|nr:ABC transporter ATP-binding protein [Methanomassiliicoccus sp.]
MITQKGHQPVVHVEKLVKRYRDSEKKAVDEISFDVYPGEFFAFLGPNGAGKTTTISILTTTLAKTSGVVRIGGYDMDKQQKEIRQSIGIVFQNPSLDANLTAEENIRLHVSLYGVYGYRPTFTMMPQEYKDKITELAKVLGMDQEMFLQVKTFSGGMKRKLEIIRSLMHKPKVLFLDEPTQGLDAVSRRSLWTYLRKVHKDEGMTIFLTTHYIEEAEGADRVCIVNHGKILFNGTPDEMKDLMMDKYILVDAEDRTALKADLASFVTENTDDGCLRIMFTENTPQAILSKIKVPLTVMHLHIPSLEEAYVDLVNNGNDKGEVC